MGLGGAMQKQAAWRILAPPPKPEESGWVRQAQEEMAFPGGFTQTSNRHEELQGSVRVYLQALGHFHSSAGMLTALPGTGTANMFQERLGEPSAFCV